MCHDTGFSSPKADRLGGRRCRDLGIQQPTLWGWPLLQPSWGYQWLPLVPTVFIPENPCEDKRISPPFGWLLTGTIRKKHWSCSGTGTKHSSHHSSCFKIQSSQPSCRTAYLYMCMETRELHTKKRGFWLLLGNLPLVLVPAMHQIRDLQKPLMMLAYLWTFWRQHCRHAMYQQFVQKRLGVLQHFLYVYKCQASCIYTNGIPKV